MPSHLKRLSHICVKCFLLHPPLNLQNPNFWNWQISPSILCVQFWISLFIYSILNSVAKCLKTMLVSNLGYLYSCFRLLSVQEQKCNISTDSIYSVWIFMFDTVPEGIRVKIRRVSIIYNISHQEVWVLGHAPVVIVAIVQWSGPQRGCRCRTSLEELGLSWKRPNKPKNPRWGFGLRGVRRCWPPCTHS